MKNDNTIGIKNQKIYPIIFLLISTVIIVSLKWLISYLFFPSEPLLNKVIFDLEDHLYFSLISNLSNFNFNPDYLANYIPNKIIPFPIYSLIIHAAIYSIFNEYSFIIVEYFSLFLFLYILFKIFKELNINIYFSIIFALGVFLLPEFLIYFKHSGINLINFDILQALYSFRIPRPIISNIYFFWGLLLAIYFYKYKNNNYFFALVGINLALNFGSFYYNFVILSVLYFILFLAKILKNNKDFFLFFLKKIFITLIFFLIFLIPFIIILFFSEKDYWVRVGEFYPTFDQKKILLNYILFKFLNLKFLLVFFINTIFLFFLLKKQNFFCKKSITVLYLFFISSCISLILFILFSPSLIQIYHFIDLITVIGILLTLIFIILVLVTMFKTYIKIHKYYNFMFVNNFYFLLLILLLSIIFDVNYFLNYKKNINLDLRNDMNIFYNYLNKNNNYKNLDSILTFNTKIQAWWLLLGKKKLSTIESIATPLKTADLELNFIDNLKFLNISEKNFNNLISNKKAGWRYDNKYIKYFSFYKYQANSLITYNKSENFKDEVLIFIKNSSPIFTQQIVVPKEEIKRLNNLFNDTHGLFFKKPDIIITEKNTLITKYSSVNLNNYCKLTKPKYLNIYLNLKKVNCNLF